MSFKRIASRVFSLVCILGFFVQVQQVSELYFRFQTTSKTVYQVRDFEYYQSITYCPRFIDVLTHTDPQNFDGEPNSINWMEYHLNQSLQSGKLTIKNILERTPHELDVITECVLRQGRVSAPVIMKKEDCLAFFKVVKTVTGERVCYTFMPRLQVNFTVGDVASSRTNINVVYQIFLESSISKSHYVFFISSDMSEKFSTRTLLHSRAFQAAFDNLNTFNRSRIYIYGDSIEINRLPRPYDTGCVPGHDREVCYEDCLVNKFKAINRVPWSGFHEEKRDITILITTDFKNETVLKFTDQAFEECQLRCRIKTGCVIQFSKTTAEEHQGDVLTLLSMLPSAPHMSLFSVPSLNLVEFIVQIGSSFGMWFGLSIISFSSIKWKALQKKDRLTVVSNTRGRFFLIKRNTQE